MNTLKKFNSDFTKGDYILYRICQILFNLIVKSFRKKYGYSTYFLFSHENWDNTDELPIPNDFLIQLSKTDVEYLQQNKDYLKHINKNLQRYFNSRISFKKDYTITVKDCLPLYCVKNSKIKELIVDHLITLNKNYIKKELIRIKNSENPEEIKIHLTENFHPKIDLFIEIIKLNDEFNCNLSFEDVNGTIIITISNFKK